jgi:hypothetical protein
VYIAQLCKDGGVECVRTVVAFVEKIGKAVAGVFELSGKEGLPREDL